MWIFVFIEDYQQSGIKIFFLFLELCLFLNTPRGSFQLLNSFNNFFETIGKIYIYFFFAYVFRIYFVNTLSHYLNEI